MSRLSRRQLPSGRLDLRPLSGLRALACFCVILSHMVFFLSFGAEDKHALYAALQEHRWLTLSLSFSVSGPCMDLFFVITGFLAALTLFPALERPDSPWLALSA